MSWGELITRYALRVLLFHPFAAYQNVVDQLARDLEYLHSLPSIIRSIPTPTFRDVAVCVRIHLKFYIGNLRTPSVIARHFAESLLYMSIHNPRTLAVGIGFIGYLLLGTPDYPYYPRGSLVRYAMDLEEAEFRRQTLAIFAYIFSLCRNRPWHGAVAKWLCIIMGLSEHQELVLTFISGYRWYGWILIIINFYIRNEEGAEETACQPRMMAYKLKYQYELLRGGEKCALAWVDHRQRAESEFRNKHPELLVEWTRWDEPGGVTYFDVYRASLPI